MKHSPFSPSAMQQAHSARRQALHVSKYLRTPTLCISMLLLSCISLKSAISKDEAKALLTKALNEDTPGMYVHSPILQGPKGYDQWHLDQIMAVEKAGYWVTERKMVKESLNSPQREAVLIISLTDKIKPVLSRQDVPAQRLADGTRFLDLRLIVGTFKVEIISISEVKTESSGNTVCDVEYQYRLEPNEIAEIFDKEPQWVQGACRFTKGNRQWRPDYVKRPKLAW